MEQLDIRKKHQQHGHHGPVVIVLVCPVVLVIVLGTESLEIRTSPLSQRSLQTLFSDQGAVSELRSK